MVRPKKTPTSTLISRKTVVSKSKNTNDEIVLNKKNDSNDNNNNKNLRKRDLKKNQKLDNNNNADEDNDANDNNNNDDVSIENDETVKNSTKINDDLINEHKRTRKTLMNKSEKIPTQNDNNLEQIEPRKRRIASLNAEFLVHYCSSSSNNNNNNNTVGNNIDSKKSNNCDNLSNASSKPELNTTNKRQRVNSLNSDKKLKKTDEHSDDEQMSAETDNVSTKKKLAKTMNSNSNLKKISIKSEPDRKLIKKSNEIKSEQTDDGDACNDDDDDEEELEEPKTLKRKSLPTRNSKKSIDTTPNKATTRLSISKTSKRSVNKKDEVEHMTDENGDSEDIKPNNRRKQLLANKNSKSSLNKTNSKTNLKYEDSETDDDMDEKSISSLNSNKRRKKKPLIKSETTNHAATASTRPKREAGMRASAMIIQTNEIEKTRFQYYSSSNITPASTLSQSNSNQQQQQQIQKSTNSKKKKTLPETNTTTIDSNLDLKSSSQGNFQIPQTMSLFASLAANTTPNETSSTAVMKSNNSKQNNKTRQTGQFSFTTPSHLNQTSLARQISSNNTNNNNHQNNNGDDSSSNDVLIVMETTTGTQKNNNNLKSNSVTAATKAAALITSAAVAAAAAAAATIITDRALTEDVLAEHNKLNGTMGCGSGTFSNHTREYITKWVLDYKSNDEKPFPPGQIPIESFGNKILNEPQYLQNKSRFGTNNSNGNTTTTATSQQHVAIAPVPSIPVLASTTATGTQKINQRNETDSKTNLNEQSSKLHNGHQPHQVSNKNSNNSNDKLNSANKKINIASSKVNNVNSDNNNNNKNTNILNENSNIGINSTSNTNLNNDSYSNNNNSNNNDNNLNYYPRPSQTNNLSNFSSSVNINDILTTTASSISLNKAITSNPALNNLAAAINLNLTLQQQHQQQQPTSSQSTHNNNNNKKSYASLVPQLPFHNHQQQHQNTKKINSSSLPAQPNTNNFSFLNSYNSSTSSTEWQLNQTLTGSNSIENLLTSGVIVNGNKSFEIWNKIKNHHQQHEINNAKSSKVDSIKAISLNNESVSQIKTDNNNTYSSITPNMTMINVENLNFYTSIDGEQQQPQQQQQQHHHHHQHYLNHDCSTCFKKLNSYHNFHQESSQTQSKSQQCNQVRAAAVAINLAKLLSNNSKNFAQNDFITSNNNTEATTLKYPHKKQRLNRSLDNIPKSDLEENWSTTTQKNSNSIINNDSNKDSTLASSAPSIKITKQNEQNDKESIISLSSFSSSVDKIETTTTKRNNTSTSIKTNKKIIIQKESSASALSCSCRIKLEPECMTITIDTNNKDDNDKGHNCGTSKNFKQIDLKLSPGRVNITKKKSNNNNNNNNEQSDSESDAGSQCSSSSGGSIHLQIDEASTIIEPSSDALFSNFSKTKTTSDSTTTELKVIKSESMDQESATFNASNNNFILTDSKDNNSLSAKFFFSNKISNDMETTTNQQDESNDFKNISKKNQRWNLFHELENENITKKYYSSIVDNTNTNLKINLNDFVIFNSDKFSNNKLQAPVTNNAFNDLINESSNTNYSADDEDDLKLFQDNSICFGQVNSIWIDPANDMPMLKIKAFFKPDQIKHYNLDESEKVYEENELISSNYYFDEFEAENIKQKCLIFDKKAYQKWCSEKQESEAEKSNQIESSTAFFYRYEYDTNKKCFIVQ